MTRAGDPAKYFVRMMAGAESNICMSVTVSWNDPRSLCSPHSTRKHWLGFWLPCTAFGRRYAFEGVAAVASCVINPPALLHR